MPERIATPAEFGFPGDAPQRPASDWALAVGPEEYDKWVARMDRVRHPSNMEQPPPVARDPDDPIPRVVAPFEQADITFSMDPNWDAPEEVQLQWWRMTNMCTNLKSRRSPQALSSAL